MQGSLFHLWGKIGTPMNWYDDLSKQWVTKILAA